MIHLLTLLKIQEEQVTHYRPHFLWFHGEASNFGSSWSTSNTQKGRSVSFPFNTLYHNRYTETSVLPTTTSVKGSHINENEPRTPSTLMIALYKSNTSDGESMNFRRIKLYGDTSGTRNFPPLLLPIWIKNSAMNEIVVSEESHKTPTILEDDDVSYSEDHLFPSWLEKDKEGLGCVPRNTTTLRSPGEGSPRLFLCQLHNLGIILTQYINASVFESTTAIDLIRDLPIYCVGHLMERNLYQTLWQSVCHVFKRLESAWSKKSSPLTNNKAHVTLLGQVKELFFYMKRCFFS